MNHFGLQTGDSGKPNFKKAFCHIMDGCGKKPVLAIDRNTSDFLMHLETPRGAVCRTDRSTVEGLTKYHNSYLYHAIYEVLYVMP